MKRTASFLLAMAIVMNMGLPVGASPATNPTANGGASSPTQNLPIKENPGEATPGFSETPPSSMDPMTPIAPSEPVPGQPVAPPSGQMFKINEVTAKVTPFPLTSAGGKVSFTIKGDYLTQEHIWLKIDRSGVPYKVIPVEKTSGFLDMLKGALLPSSNITTLNTADVVLDPSTKETMDLYTVSLYHSTDEYVLDDTSSSWADCNVEPIVVPRAEGGLTDQELTPGSSFPGEALPPDFLPGEDFPADGQPDSNQPDNSLPEISEDEEMTPPLDELSPPIYDTVPGDSTPATPPPYIPETPELPAVPEETPAEITGAEASTMPSPLTSAGGYAMVGVFGKSLDKGTVWVKVDSTSPDFETQIIQADKSKSSIGAYTDKISLPANPSDAEVVYTVSTLHRADGDSSPEANSPDWANMSESKIIVPKKAPTEVPSVDDSTAGTQQVDSVAAITTPGVMTSKGGVVCVTASGQNLDKGKLWLMLDNGEEVIIRKFQDVTAMLGVSQQIVLQENTSTTKDNVYKVSVMAGVDSVGTPGANDSGWKRYSDASVTVPHKSEAELPTISNIVWTPFTNAEEISARFYLSGSNFTEGENSLWVKVAPNGEDTGSKVFPANLSLTASSSETELAKFKALDRSGEKIDYQVFAMAKTDNKKPSARDEGWKTFAQKNLVQEDTSTKPAVTSALVSPAYLPNEGGMVKAMIGGENLERQTAYITATPIGNEGEKITRAAEFDPATGDLKAEFPIVPTTEENAAEEQRYTFQYQLGRSASWNSMGGAVRAAAPAPFAALAPVYSYTEIGTGTGTGITDENAITSAGAKMVVTVPTANITPGDTVYVKANGLVLTCVAVGTDVAVDFILAANTTALDVKHYVYVIEAASVPALDAAIWATAIEESVTVPKAVATITEADVVQAGKTPDYTGTDVTVTLKGTNLNLTDQQIEAKYSLTIDTDGFKPASPITPTEAGKVSTTISIGENVTTGPLIYKLYARIVPTGAQQVAWQEVTGANVQVTVPANSNIPAITSIEVLPTTVSNNALSVTATVSGTNFTGKKIFISIREKVMTSSLADSDKQIEATVESPINAKATFSMPTNSTDVDKKYSVWGVGTSGGEPATGADWKLFGDEGSLTVKAQNGASILGVAADLPSGGLTSAGGTITASVTGTDLNNLTGKSWVWVQVKSGASSQIIQAATLDSVTNAKLTTDNMTIAPNTSTSTDQEYTVSVITTSTNAKPADTAFNTPLFKSTFKVPKVTEKVPSIDSVVLNPTKLTSDGGKIGLVITGKNLGDKKIYLFSVGSSMTTAIQANLQADGTYTAELIFPGNPTKLANKPYDIMATILPLATATPPSYTDNPSSWTKIASTEVEAIPSLPTDPKITKVEPTIPLTGMTTVKPIEFKFTGVNLDKAFLYIYEATAHTELKGKATTTPTITRVTTVSADKTLATLIVTPKVGLNCYYALISETAVTDAALAPVITHLGDVTLAADPTTATPMYVSSYKATIDTLKEQTVNISLKKDAFPTDSTERAKFLVRAVAKGSLTAVAPAANLAFAIDPTIATSAITFPATVAAGEYEVQGSMDGGTTFTTLISGATGTTPTIITAKAGGSSGGGGVTDPNGMYIKKYSATITAKKEFKMPVTIQKNTFSTDSAVRSKYAIRAVKSGTADSVVALPVLLTGYSTDNTTADATLIFPSSTVDGEKFEIQGTEDGTTYLSLSAPGSTEKIIVTAKTDGGTTADKDKGINFVDSDELLKAIEDAKYSGNSQVLISVSKDFRVGRDFFKEAEYCDKDIVLENKNFRWTIEAGSEMAAEIERTYDLGLTFASQYEKDMQKMVGKRDYIPFHIGYHGPLPTKMLLTILNTGYDRGTDLYTYRYNVDTADATSVADPVADYDGETSFYMKSCSDYFITDRLLADQYLNVDEDKLGDGTDSWVNGDSENSTGNNTSKPNPNTGF